MSLLRRLDEVDRRFGLTPHRTDGRQDTKRRSVLIVALFALFLVELIVVLAGRPGAALVAKVGVTSGGVAVAVVWLFIQFRRHGPRTEAGDRDIPPH